MEQDSEDREEHNEERDDSEEDDEHVDANTGIGSAGDIEEDSDGSRTLSLHSSNQDHGHSHQDNPGDTADGDPPASADSPALVESPPLTPSSTVEVFEDSFEDQLERPTALAGTASGEQPAVVDRLGRELELERTEAQKLRVSLGQLTRAHEAVTSKMTRLRSENGKLREDNAELLALNAEAGGPGAANKGDPALRGRQSMTLELQQDNWKLVAQQRSLAEYSELENDELERSVGDLRSTIREKEQQIDALKQFANESQHGGGLTQIMDPAGSGEVIGIGEVSLRFSRQLSRLTQLGVPDALLDGPGGQHEGLIKSLLRDDDALHDAFDYPTEHYTVDGTAGGHHLTADPKVVRFLVDMVEREGDPGPVRELFQYLEDETDEVGLADQVWQLLAKLVAVKEAEASDSGKQPLGDNTRLVVELRESRAERDRLQEKLRRFKREAIFVEDLKKIVAANKRGAETDEGQDPTERKAELVDSVIHQLQELGRTGQGYHMYNYPSSSSSGSDKNDTEEQLEYEPSLEHDLYADVLWELEDEPDHLPSIGEPGPSSVPAAPSRPRRSTTVGGGDATQALPMPPTSHPRKPARTGSFSAARSIPRPPTSYPSEPTQARSWSAAQEVTRRRHAGSFGGQLRSESMPVDQGAAPAPARNIPFENSRLLAQYAEVERLKRVLGETIAKHSSCTEAIDKLTTERDAANDKAKGLEGQLGELRASQQRTPAAATALRKKSSWVPVPWFLGGGGQAEVAVAEPDRAAADDDDDNYDGGEEPSLVQSKDLAAELARLQTVVDVLMHDSKLPKADGESLRRSLEAAQGAARELNDTVRRLERGSLASAETIRDLEQKHWRANSKIDELQRVLNDSISKATHDESRSQLQEAHKKITLLRSARAELRGSNSTLLDAFRRADASSRHLTREIEELRAEAEAQLGEAARENEDLEARTERLKARYETLGLVVQAAVQAMGGDVAVADDDDGPGVEGQSAEDREHVRIILDLERAMRSHRARVSLEGHAGEIARALREAREVHAAWRVRLKRRRRGQWPFAGAPTEAAAVDEMPGVATADMQRTYAERKTELAAVLSGLGQVRAELGRAGVEVAKDASPGPWRLRVPSMLCHSCETQAARSRLEGTAWPALVLILMRPFFSVWVVALWLLGVATWFYQAASRISGRLVTSLVDRVWVWEELRDGKAANGEEQNNDEANAASPSTSPTTRNEERPDNETVAGEERRSIDYSTMSSLAPPGTVAAFPAVPRVEIVETAVFILLVLVCLFYFALSQERQLWLGANGAAMRRAYINEIRSRGDAVYVTWTPFLKIDFRPLYEPWLGDTVEWLSDTVTRAVDGIWMAPAVASNTIQWSTGAVGRTISGVWETLAMASSHTIQYFAGAAERAVSGVSRMAAVTSNTVLWFANAAGRAILSVWKRSTGLSARMVAVPWLNNTTEWLSGAWERVQGLLAFSWRMIAATGLWLMKSIRWQFGTARAAWGRLGDGTEWLLDDFWANIGGALGWLFTVLKRMAFFYALGVIWVRLMRRD
ncbi:hypothetical protein RB601_000975 [Gaeumannomyces tritici]